MYYFNRIPDISLYQLPSFLAKSSLFKIMLPKLTLKKNPKSDYIFLLWEILPDVLTTYTKCLRKP